MVTLLIKNVSKELHKKIRQFSLDTDLNMNDSLIKLLEEGVVNVKKISISKMVQDSSEHEVSS